jgi:hypothetical protein
MACSKGNLAARGRQVGVLCLLLVVTLRVFAGCFSREPVVFGSVFGGGPGLVPTEREYQRIVLYSQTWAEGTEDPGLFQGSGGGIGDSSSVEEPLCIVPRCLALAPGETLYIAEAGRVQRMATDGTRLGTMGEGIVEYSWMGADATGAVYILVGKRPYSVVKISPDGVLLWRTAPVIRWILPFAQVDLAGELEFITNTIISHNSIGDAIHVTISSDGVVSTSTALPPGPEFLSFTYDDPTGRRYRFQQLEDGTLRLFRVSGGRRLKPLADLPKDVGEPFGFDGDGRLYCKAVKKEPGGGTNADWPRETSFAVVIDPLSPDFWKVELGENVSAAVVDAGGTIYVLSWDLEGMEVAKYVPAGG